MARKCSSCGKQDPVVLMINTMVFVGMPAKKDVVMSWHNWPGAVLIPPRGTRLIFAEETCYPLSGEQLHIGGSHVATSFTQ